MEQPLISVIMPAYNASDFINGAIESVVNQVYRNIEFLIIDDGSTDNTLDICAGYASRDNRIRVISQENSGAAAARNRGMREALGDYIFFIDSDDSMHPHTLEILYKLLSENHVSLSMVNFIEESAPHRDWGEVHIPDEAVIYSQEDMMDILCSGGENLKLRLLLTVPWCKLYHRELLEGLYYPEGTICEDEFMINSIVSKCNKMAFMDVQLYSYLVHPGSVMHVKFGMERLASMRAFEDRIECAKSLGFKSCAEKMIKNFIKDHIGNYCKACAENCDDKEVYNTLKSSFRKNFLKYYRVLDKSEKIKGIIFYISPKCYLIVKKLILHDVYEE